MVRLFLILVAVTVVLTIFAVVDAAVADRTRVRGLPRPVWFIVIVFIPLVGALLWFFVGRPRRADGGRPGQTRRKAGGNRRRSSPRPSGPDDDPDFLRRLQRDLDKDDDTRE
jgi:peptidoglycan/LPS O-acetylase OafA/YrhL